VDGGAGKLTDRVPLTVEPACPLAAGGVRSAGVIEHVLVVTTVDRARILTLPTREPLVLYLETTRGYHQ
jgi:hypothetical protein